MDAKKRKQIRFLCISIMLMVVTVLNACGVNSVSKEKESVINAMSEVAHVEVSVIEEEFPDFEIVASDTSTRYRARQIVEGFEVYGGELIAVVDEKGAVKEPSGRYYKRIKSTPGFDQFIEEMKAAPDIPDEVSILEGAGFEVEKNTIEKIIICDDDAITYGYRIMTYSEQGPIEFVIDSEGIVIDIVFGFAYYTSFDVDKSSPIDMKSPVTGDSVGLSEYQGEIYAYNPRYDFYVTVEKNKGDELDASRIDLAYTTDDWSKSGISSRVIKVTEDMESICNFWENEVGVTQSRERLEIRINTETHNGPFTTGSCIIIDSSREGDKFEDFPEMLCHEYTHLIMRKLNKYKAVAGEGAAIDEACADIFAAIYKKNWWLADNAKDDNYPHPIPDKNRTMDDYAYLLSKTEDNGYGLIAELFNDGAGLVFRLRGEGVDKESIAELSGYNSTIISHTVYEIWQTILDENYDTLCSIMKRTIDLLPTYASFAEFKGCFICAMRDICGEQASEQARTIFNKSGIKEEKVLYVYDNPVKIGNKRTIEDPKPDSDMQIYSDTLDQYDYFRLEDLNNDGSQELIATGADGIYSEDGKYYAFWADVFSVIGGEVTLTGCLGNNFFDELIIYDEEENCMYTIDDSGSVDSLSKYYMDKNSHLLSEILVAYDEEDDESYMLNRFDLTDGAGPYESQYLEEDEYFDLAGAWADRIAEHNPLSFEPKSKMKE